MEEFFPLLLRKEASFLETNFSPKNFLLILKDRLVSVYGNLVNKLFSKVGISRLVLLNWAYVRREEEKIEDKLNDKIFELVFAKKNDSSLLDAKLSRLITLP